MLLRIFAQGFEIRLVLEAAGGSLVGDQMISIEKEYRETIQLAGYALGPSVGGGDTGDGGQQIDPVGRPAELNHLIRFSEVAGAEASQGKPKLVECGHDTSGVLFTRYNKQINVTGVARAPVEGKSKSANNQVLNAVRVEQLDKLSQILL